jgi:hypothetical protein
MANDYKIVWMRSILRLEVIGDPFTWSDEEVVFAFAARTKQDCISYENWCSRMGLADKPMTTEEGNSAALSLLRATGGGGAIITEKPK